MRETAEPATSRTLALGGHVCIHPAHVVVQALACRRFVVLARMGVARAPWLSEETAIGRINKAVEPKIGNSCATHAF